MHCEGEGAYATSDNPSNKDKKTFEEESLKGLRALSCLQLAFTDEIFYKIVGYDTSKKVQNKLEEKFQRSNRVKTIKFLTLKSEFEMLMMQKSDDIKTYETRVMKIVNQIKLAGE